MGADWFFNSLFYGIIVDRKLLMKLYKKYDKSTEYSFLLVEESTHTRTEGEELSDKLKRCVGFIGICIENAMPLEDLITKREEMKEYFSTTFGITYSPQIVAGSDCGIDYLFDEEESEEVDEVEESEESEEVCENCECDISEEANIHIFCLSRVVGQEVEEQTWCSTCWHDNEKEMREEGWTCDEDDDSENKDSENKDSEDKNICVCGSKISEDKKNYMLILTHDKEEEVACSTCWQDKWKREENKE